MDQNKKLLEYLKPFVSQNKQQLFATIIPNRMRHLTVVLEDIFQPHNASAVIRTCDCFGVQNLHIIENRNEYTLNPDVSLGADKWITRHHYNQPNTNNTQHCIENLKQQGYKIVATTPYKKSHSPHDIPLDKPLALCFGTELNGLTNQVLDKADYFLQIPMYGFTESFNISVSAALVLHTLTHRLHHSNIKWQLSAEQQIKLELSWVKNVIGPRKAPLLEKRFLEKH